MLVNATESITKVGKPMGTPRFLDAYIETENGPNGDPQFVLCLLSGRPIATFVHYQDAQAFLLYHQNTVNLRDHIRTIQDDVNSVYVKTEYGDDDDSEISYDLENIKAKLEGLADSLDEYIEDFGP